MIAYRIILLQKLILAQPIVLAAMYITKFTVMFAVCTPHYVVFIKIVPSVKYEGWNFNSGNYLFTTDTK
jgi:hypothetical protein